MSFLKQQAFSSCTKRYKRNPQQISKVEIGLADLKLLSFVLPDLLTVMSMRPVPLNSVQGYSCVLLTTIECSGLSILQ